MRIRKLDHFVLTVRDIEKTISFYTSVMEMTKEEFLGWCKENFPGYKRPRRVEFGDIPRGATRKILKPELRKRYTKESNLEP